MITYGKVLALGIKNFSARGRAGRTGPTNENVGPHIISEIISARQLKLKTPLHMMEYSLLV